jgi:hypothetical protein
MQGRYEGIISEERGFNSHGTEICALLSGIGIGALLMYLFDPDRGRGRRARLSDQVTSKANYLKGAAESKARDLKDRAEGAFHDLGSLLPKSDEIELERRPATMRASGLSD